MPLSNPTLRRSLIGQLLGLNFHAYLQTIARLLRKMGYEDVSLASRTDFVGRNQDGGVDLRAYRSVPGGRRLVVIQTKQYLPERLLYRRTLDELRGVMLRAGAAEGILITTSRFSESVSKSVAASAAIAPLRLIDGYDLAELLTLYRVGVNKGSPPANASQSRYRLDRDFFVQMESCFAGVARPLVGDRLYTGFLVRITPRKRRS